MLAEEARRGTTHRDAFREPMSSFRGTATCNAAGCEICTGVMQPKLDGARSSDPSSVTKDVWACNSTSM